MVYIGEACITLSVQFCALIAGLWSSRQLPSLRRHITRYLQVCTFSAFPLSYYHTQ